MGTLIYIVLGLLLGGFGYLSVRYPEDAIYLLNYWRHTSFEPSQRYIRLTRIGGILYIILAVTLIVLAFILF